MKNQPSPSCAPIFVIAYLTTFVWFAAQIDWTSRAASPLVVMIIICGSILTALVIGVGYGIWKDTHDPESEESADIMNAMYHSGIPESIWSEAVGIKNISQNNNRYFWKEGWNLRKVYLENEIKRSLEHGIVPSDKLSVLRHGIYPDAGLDPGYADQDDRHTGKV